MEITGIISCAKPQTTKQGSPYQVITVLTKEQSYTINVWGAKSIEVGKLFSSTKVKDSDGFLSVTSTDYSITKPSPELEALLPHAISKEEFQRCVLSVAKFCKPAEESFLISLSEKLYNPYSVSTAARSHHHNFLGGLLQHTYELLHLFEGIYTFLPFKVDPFIVIVSCILHDAGKLQEYTKDFDYKPKFFLLGHPFMSAELAGKLLEGFPENVITHVQHCILAHHGRLEFGSPVLPASPEAFLVAKLDELSGCGVQYDVPTGTKTNSTTIQRYESK